MRPQTLLRLASTETEVDDGLADKDLLSRFATGRDPAAFELLVWRHSGMVLRVCRRITGDHHLAEDACQATFLALARHAGAVGRGSVAGWLYRVARRTGTRAALRAARKPVVMADFPDHFPAPSPPTTSDPALIEALDTEIANLPERFRAPVLLCFFEGLTQKTAAERLGIPVGTVAAHIARAKERLRRRLASRGFVGSGCSLVAVLATGTVDAMPAFVAATSRAAVKFAAGESAGVSHSILTLAQVAGGTMHGTTVRWAMSMVALCVTATLGSLWVAGGVNPSNPSPSAEGASPMGGRTLRISRLSVDANDLVEAHALNIYKFTVEIEKGQQFHVVLRERDNEDAAPREVKKFTFRRSEKDGPTTLRIDFTRTDGIVGGVLLSDQKQTVFRVNCSDCEPSDMASVVAVPLSRLKSAERTLIASDKGNQEQHVKETQLLSIVPTNGLGESNFPRADLLIEKE